MGALPGGFGPAVEAGSQNQSHLAQLEKDGQKILYLKKRKKGIIVILALIKSWSSSPAIA